MGYLGQLAPHFRFVTQAMIDGLGEAPLKIVMLAQEEARSLGAERLGTEHLLLAMLGFDNAAASALQGFGVSYDDVRLEVEDINMGKDALPLDAEIQLSERALRVIELSYLEAQGLKHDRVDAEHLLLAILRLGLGVAVGILAKLGVNMVDLEIALLYQCSSALAAPQQDVAAELGVQIEVWERLFAIARQQGYEELEREASRHKKIYRDALSELQTSLACPESDAQSGDLIEQPGRRVNNKSGF
jgi:ATP-dependent Clp protease ATP-binding subunit ClpA